MSRRSVKYGSTDDPTLSDQVRIWRIHRGLTQSELERRAGLSHNTVSRIERGEVSPRLDTVESLAEAMDLSVEELSFRQPSMRVQEDPSDSKGDFERLKERLDRLPEGKRRNLMRVLSELLDMAESE